MEMVTSSCAVVPEILQKDNYERWSILMQHYLTAQDLWDVVRSDKMVSERNKKEWIKKNALALHAIGISCGIEAFDEIKKIDTAKGAWDTLAALLKPPPTVEVIGHDNSELHQESQTEHQETLQKIVCNEPISSLKRFLHDNQDAKSPEMLYHVLKFAITCGRKNMAHFLYREIPHDFLQGDRGFFLLEECITKKMFDIALDLLHNYSELAFKCPSSSTPIILTLAQTPPQFLNELGFWRLWIYKSTRVKVFPIKPRSAVPAGGVGIVEDKLRKWIFPVLYKFHLVSVMIGLLCWLPCWLPVRMEGLGMLVEVFLLFIVPLLKLDLLCVLIGVPLLTLVPSEKQGLFWALLGVFILLLVIVRKLDKDLLRLPIGMPLVLLGVPISLSLSRSSLVLPRVILFALFLLFSMPLLSFVLQTYNLKLMDEYGLEVIRFICESLSKLNENQFVQSGAVEATFQAIKNGIPEIVNELITKANANILWSCTDLEDSRNMFACAVAHRQEKIARFLHDEFGASKDTNMVTTNDEDGNNILHVVAQLAPHSQLDHISGAPLQLQSELRWFKSVEGIVPRFYNQQKNRDGETPTQVFLREHRNLLKEAEEWMKKAAESCTVVGALVITIMFAAAFTVPGGNNEETGFPIFLNTTTSSSNSISFTVVPFMVFAVSDAIALFAASSSVLMFMGILTSRYACQDFHISLAMKLIIGLSSLFISIAAMMVAFCASLLMLLHGKSKVVTSIIVLATIPITLFILLQSPLLVEIYTSTFRPDVFYRRKYSKSRFCLSLNRRWWFRTRKGRMVIMLCALFLLYLISFVWLAIAF